MIGTIEGQLVAAKLKQPQAGQDFKPHHMLSLQQINDGEAEIVKIKDLDLSRPHKAGINVRYRCKINHWSNQNASGQAITLLEVIK